MVIPHYMGSREPNPHNEKQNAFSQDVTKQFPFSPCQDIPLISSLEPDVLSKNDGDAEVNGSSRIGLSEQSTRSSQWQNNSFQNANIGQSVKDVQKKEFVDDLSYPRDQKEQNFNLIDQPPIQNMEWWETQDRARQLESTDESRQVGPRTPCRCQVCKKSSGENWNIIICSCLLCCL